MAVPDPIAWHWVLGWVFDVLFIGGGIGFVIFGVKSRALALRSREWPRLPGVIISSRLTESDGQAEVHYAYEIDGVRHAGKRFRAGYWLCVPGSSAQRIVARYPAGSPVEVVYDPTEPGSSLLEPGYTGSAWAVVAFGALFIGMGILFGILYAFYPEGHTWHLRG